MAAGGPVAIVREKEVSAMTTTSKTSTTQPTKHPEGLGARVLCGVDTSPESQVAARQAVTLAEPGGTIELLAAVAPIVTAPLAYGAATVVHELEEDARHIVQELAERWPGVTTKVELGSPAEVLLQEVRRLGATLVVVGGHDTHRLPGILLGRVATHLLHRAPCSVLVARERDQGIAFPRAIVAGTDGSTHGTEAVRVACALGARFDAPVRVVVATGADPVDVDQLRDIDRLEWSDRPPVEALTAAAAGADLLVVGTRGLRGLRALGSVSERVGHTAPCSVLVVRPGAAT
jgi:nucleotide-binding universal stress UspA family protein